MNTGVRQDSNLRCVWLTVLEPQSSALDQLGHLHHLILKFMKTL